MARLGLLQQAVQWITVVALLGLPAAVLRLVPERGDGAAALVAAARWTSCACAVAVVGAILLLPGAAPRLLGDREAASSFALYGWRAVGTAQVALSVAWLHAGGRLARKGLLEAFDRVLLLALGAAGAAVAGFDGLVVGTVAASALAVAAGIGLSGAPPAPRSGDVAPLLRVGRPQLLLSVVETLRPLAVLRLATITIGDVATGHLATAMAFALPLIAVPELAAQALFPRMLTSVGEAEHVEGERRRLLREILLAGIPLLVVYGALAAWLLPTVGTGRYAGAVAPLLVLLPGVLAHGLTAHTGYVLLVRDRLGRAALASAASLVATGILAYLLIGRFGAAGGAAALSLALVLRAVLFVAASGGGPRRGDPAAAGEGAAA
jgi:O-antigen/teichoic acid export membrane protein